MTDGLNKPTATADICSFCGCERAGYVGKDFDGRDLLRFDCGSVTGSPQSRACKVIAADRAQLAEWRPVVEAATAVSDADLSVYDDVPNAHDLMNQLDRAVDQLRTPSTDQETP